MQFNSALIHWGSLTGNTTIRDLGIYLYATEQSAVEEYWFDIYERNLSPSHPYSLVSLEFGGTPMIMVHFGLMILQLLMALNYIQFMEVLCI